MTAISNSLAQVSFHEATLLDIVPHHDAIDLLLEDVLLDSHRQPARVTIAGVRTILRDGVPRDAFTMEMPDAENLTLRQDSRDVCLIVEWNDFSVKAQATAAYRFPGASLSLAAQQSAVA